MGRKIKKGPKGPFLLVKIFSHLNTCMTHKLLVTTYNEDAKQFEMFCYCLNKNWRGNRFITIVINSIIPYTSDIDWDNFFQQMTNITRCHLIDWTVELIDGRHKDHHGYREQAVNKVIHSIDPRFEDVVVLDAKDFLLRPADISMFKVNNKYRVTYWLEGRLIDLYSTAHKLLDSDMSHIPAILNLTPWIWNVTQLEKYWAYMLDRFGLYLSWDDMYQGGGEVDSYYAYSYCDTTKSFEFLPPDQNPLLIGGVWGAQTYLGAVKEAKDFDSDSRRIIWKHSRKAAEKNCIDITKSMLVKYGIDQVYIDQVYTA